MYGTARDFDLMVTTTKSTISSSLQTLSLSKLLAKILAWHCRLHHYTLVEYAWRFSQLFFKIFFWASFLAFLVSFFSFSISFLTGGSVNILVDPVLLCWLVFFRNGAFGKEKILRLPVWGDVVKKHG